MSGTIVPSGDDEARLGPDTAQAADLPAASALSVGQQLSTARLAKGLTPSDVARALKLSLRQVEALEADDWPNLPCATIIRGFVRNYARLLGLDADRLMSVLDQLTLPPGAELEMSVGTPVNIPREGKVDRRDFVRVLSGLIVLLLAISAYFFLPQELWLSTVSALKSATQPADATKVVAEKVVAAEPQEIKAPDVAAASVAASPLVEAPTAPVAPPVAVAPTSASVLKFNFAQPSWVEVRDRSGQVIFSQKNVAGSQREIEGQPPFALIIGNSAHVTLQYKGKAVDLSKRSKDDVARLTLE